MSSNSSFKRKLLVAGVVAALLLIGAGALFAASTWGEVNRVSIDRPDPSAQSGGPEANSEDPAEPSDSPENESIDIGLQVILLVGSDSRSDLEDTEGFGEFEGNRADVVMVLIKDGAHTGLLSLPRDLVVEDPCRDVEERLSETLQGCPTMNGATVLTLAVEDLIGRSVDHFAMVDLAGFQAAVNAVGGYEVCVDRPVRDQRANLSLPAGCTLADGDQTLAWLRSRRTQELTDDGWSTIPGVNDLIRNERQRAFLIDMMGRISDFSSPQAMAQAAQAVAPYVTVDSDLSLMNAVDIASTMRGLRSGAVTELAVPVYDDSIAGGAAVLRPSTPVDEIVAEFLSTTAGDDGVILGLSK